MLGYPTERTRFRAVLRGFSSSYRWGYDSFGQHLQRKRKFRDRIQGNHSTKKCTVAVEGEHP